jgi:hypothetical protein
MRLPNIVFATAASLLAALAVACGAGSTAPVTASTPAPSSSSPATAAGAEADAVPAVWSRTLPKEQQMAYMRKNVAPRMARVFQSANGTRYADFGCKTCHGPENKVPRDYLPPLTMKGGKITAFAEKPEIAKLMAQHVVPEMASSLGQPPYDPQTNEGFGCGGCHAIEMK